MTIQFHRQGMAASPVVFPRAESAFVRRLLEARDDAVKFRVREWLMRLDDQRLMGFGLTKDDIALLRGSLPIPSNGPSGSSVGPPIAVVEASLAGRKIP
jgi:hypothetical protein